MLVQEPMRLLHGDGSIELRIGGPLHQGPRSQQPRPQVTSPYVAPQDVASPFTWSTCPGVPGMAINPLPLVACVDRPPGTPRRPGCQSVVVAGAGDAEDGAQPLHAVAALMVGDELEAVHQRVSQATYFAAFRRISRSSSRSRTCLRKAAFSASSGVGGSVGVSARRPRGRLTPAART